MIDMQEQLTYLTNKFVKENAISTKIRGVTAQWKEETLTTHISFYFDGEADENELELASDTCGEIIAHVPIGVMEEDYIRLDSPDPLPESSFWAYKREDELEKDISLKFINLLTMQKKLSFVTDDCVRVNENSSKIRGVTAQWEVETLTTHITFYFDGEPDENELELASDTCGEIIAHIPIGVMEENYIRLDSPTPLPESSFWAYKRDDELEKDRKHSNPFNS